MEIRNVLVTGRLYRELESMLSGERELQFRCLADESVGESDFDWADAFVGFRPTPVFQPAKLKWVHALGAGVDSFLFGEDWNPDVLLTRTDTCFGDKIGEFCMSYMLSHCQRHKEYRAAQRNKVWVPKTNPVSLRGQRVVLFGTGSIGSTVARMCSSFGMVVHGVSRSGGWREHFARVVVLEECSDVLAQADWVINTLPLTQQTQGVFGRELFAAMRGAKFINVGRGASVNDSALLEALDAGRVTLAVLDVFAEEPLEVSSPYWEREDAIITPHISGVTSPEDAASCFLGTWSSIARGEQPANRVSPEFGY